jgi:hypothetical protein
VPATPEPPGISFIETVRDEGFLELDGFLLNGDFVQLGIGSDVLHDKNEDDLIAICLKYGSRHWDWEVGYSPNADVLRYQKPTTWGLFAGATNGDYSAIIFSI